MPHAAPVLAGFVDGAGMRMVLISFEGGSTLTNKAALGKGTTMRTVDGPRKKVKHYDVPGHADYLTFSCYRGLPLLSKDRTRLWFIEDLAKARTKHRFRSLGVGDHARTRAPADLPPQKRVLDEKDLGFHQKASCLQGDPVPEATCRRFPGRK